MRSPSMFFLLGLKPKLLLRIPVKIAKVLLSSVHPLKSSPVSAGTEQHIDCTIQLAHHSFLFTLEL